MELKLVIFDLDNTLWDFETNSREALIELYETLDINHDFQKFHRNYVEINYRYWREYEQGKITKNELRYGRFFEAFNDIGFHDRKEIEKVANRYLEISPFKKAVFENTYSVLDFIASKYKMAIITNGFNEVVEMKVKNCQFDKYFDLVQTSEDAGVQKPNPRIFQKVLDFFNLSNDEAIMIGDNLQTDIEGANSVNMRSILFDPKNEHVNYTNEKISNLIELKNIL